MLPSMLVKCDLIKNQYFQWVLYMYIYLYVYIYIYIYLSGPDDKQVKQ